MTLARHSLESTDV